MGVIDPAGFDTNQRKNSFEQLIYNIVNEHIAYHYNEYIFNKEMVFHLIRFDHFSTIEILFRILN